MKIWIARDSDNTLWIYTNKPELHFNPKTNSSFWVSTEDWWEVDEDFLPEVTFENSPMAVELKLIEK